MKLFLLSFLLLSSTLLAKGGANDTNAQLAQKLSNPISQLISVPVEYTYDQKIGPDEEGDRSSISYKPVVPFTLNDDWFLVSRTVFATTTQDDIYYNSGTQSGISDISQSFFLSPEEVGDSGWIWGVGPALLIPTANDDLLGGGKWAVGPTGVLLRQDGAWTYGVLVNHLWSFAGDEKREHVNSTYFDIWLAYTTQSAYTYLVESEPIYAWNTNGDAGVPINFTISKVTNIGSQIVSIGIGGKYWVNEVENGPKGFGAIFNMTFLFPQ